MTLDLRNCGFGNVLLMAAGHLRNGGVAVYHDAPEAELGILDLSHFVLDPDASRVDPKLNARYCNLSTLLDPAVARVMRRSANGSFGVANGSFGVANGSFGVANGSEESPKKNAADAGFCFRVRNPALDGDVEFMNEAAIEAMLRLMTRYTNPFACSNDRAVLARVTERVPWAITVDCASWGARNAADHVAQWLALSKCPIVFHGVGGNGSVTSTFAPTAAIFGGCEALVGVDPFGNACYGDSYHW